MTGLVLKRIPVADILVGRRIRPVDRRALGPLKADIEVRGLRNPIEVGQDESGRWHLVAGLHRLTAVRELGHEEIDVLVCEDDANARRERELMENLCRVELSALERCQFLHQLKSLY
ncbi:MAG: ParB N-terminal domain-containing protein, partial [Hoeflea sp.]